VEVLENGANGHESGKWETKNPSPSSAFMFALRDSKEVLVLMHVGPLVIHETTARNPFYRYLAPARKDDLSFHHLVCYELQCVFHA
jgi:hypothetical protein